MERLPLYFDPATGKQQMADDQLDARIRESFDIDLGREIFATLGANTYAKAQPIPVRGTNLFGFSPVDFSRLNGPSATSAADCTCSRGSDWCAAGMRCDASPCTATEWGCGTLWMYPCTGDCKLDS